MYYKRPSKIEYDHDQVILHSKNGKTKIYLNKII